ncbi:hypothetical protein [Chitinophaga tropicalis]|uniref:Uncharacterized protein n=1 Tax=Chitinophaga tropicalis TaxID=2683588 RepID=A0A7K1U7A9_9BACT|nr:hypothetical protein [Chitinophaga tropicalis]MVT10242.1 hypothetical protein [Chitinophaga tropicalis]
MASLTPAQQGRFLKINERLGITAEVAARQMEHLQAAQSGQRSTQSGKQELVFSSDPVESHVPPIYLSVGSIADVKRLVGVEDNNDDAHVAYPQAFPQQYADVFRTAKSKGEVFGKVHPEFFAHLEKAAHAFVMGNSRKVQEYEEAINAVLFPGRIAVFTGEDLIIPANGVLRITGPDPVYLNYQSITTGADAEIWITTKATLNTQYFNAQ